MCACCCSAAALPKRAPHAAQSNGLAPVCVAMCRRRSHGFTKPLAHVGQYDFLRGSPVCVYMCTFRLCLLANSLPHSWHCSGWRRASLGSGDVGARCGCTCGGSSEQSGSMACSSEAMAEGDDLGSPTTSGAAPQTAALDGPAALGGGSAGAGGRRSAGAGGWRSAGAGGRRLAGAGGWRLAGPPPTNEPSARGSAGC